MNSEFKQIIFVPETKEVFDGDGKYIGNGIIINDGLEVRYGKRLLRFEL